MSKFNELPEWQRVMITTLFSITGLLVMLSIFVFSDTSPSLAIPFFILVISTAAGGLTAGIINSVLVLVFSMYLFGDDLSRLVQNMPINLIMLLIVGWLRSHQIGQTKLAKVNQIKADIVDGLNGNISKVRQARESLLDILKNESMTEHLADRLRADVLHTLNNLELATVGWVALKKIRDDVKK